MAGFQKAKREQVWLKVLLSGASGCGKSYSALRLAKGIADKCGSAIAYIGTEGSRNKYYADEFDYDLLELEEPFECEKYMDAIDEAVKAGEVLNLKELISYEKDSIVNLDIVSNEKMKFFLMAFDEGTGLEPHRAPGTALITALEGRAVVEYEGKEYRLSAGESFRFEKNGLHSVKADGPYKMALLLVL